MVHFCHYSKDLPMTILKIDWINIFGVEDFMINQVVNVVHSCGLRTMKAKQINGM